MCMCRMEGRQTYSADGFRPTSRIWETLNKYDPEDDSWSDLEPKDPVPAPRDGHTMVVGGSSGEVILFGGIGSDDTPLGDTWAYAP